MIPNPLILGIESSCDETAAAVVEGGVRVRSSVIASQHDLHAEYGGVVPEIASRAHVERILPVIRAALGEAGVTYDDLHAVAVGHRPGLIGSLIVGVSAAKALAWSLGAPLIGIDHVVAHLHAAALNAPPIEFPALGLVVSGGHTSLYAMQGPLELTLLGRTIDDAAGEAFDKGASILELGYPGGPLIDRLARVGDDRAEDFPVSRLDRESLNFSFSGVKTALLYAVRGVPQGRGEHAGFERSAADLTPQRKADLAASYQRAIVRAIRLKIERALERVAPIKSLVVGGGVSANSRLRSELADLAAEHSMTLRLPALAYCVDNAAMIAGLAAERFCRGDFDDFTLAPATDSTIR